MNHSSSSSSSRAQTALLLVATGAAVAVTAAAVAAFFKRSRRVREFVILDDNDCDGGAVTVQQPCDSLLSSVNDAMLSELAGGDHLDAFCCKLGDFDCNIVVKDKRKLLKKLQAISMDGADNLEVITDFDHTLSAFEHNGARVVSCHGVLESYPALSDDDRVYFKSLFNKYYPIEICHSLPDEEKKIHMAEWWNRSQQRMIEVGFDRSVLARCVDEAGVVLRKGWQQLFKTVENNRIPCLIFSAGIGDIIQEILAQLGLKCDGDSFIRVVSNFMQFDEEGKLHSFTKPMIYTLNKTFAAFAAGGDSGVSVRRNVLLMGDTIGDLQMCEGCNADLVIKVAFLNDKIDERLHSFAEAYDIVCLRHDSLCVPLAVLDCAGADCQLPCK